MDCNLLPYRALFFPADPNSEDDFKRSGPSYLKEGIDWENTDHKRCVASSLVKGVYILERQRQQKCQATQALASLWWESFGFMLTENLVDEEGTIFGAVFIYQGKDSTSQKKKGKDSTNGCPRCVIAFRGTYNFAADIRKNKCIVRNSLHQTRSFEVAMKAVRDMVGRNGDSNVCLAGHSLGAAMVMLAGKTMAKEGSFLEAFLFNPPYLSLPIERIKSKLVKFMLHCGSTVLKAGLLLIATSASKKGNEGSLFVAISGWIPCLFVNKRDGICSEYIGYFEHRKKMEEIGVGNIARFDSQHSSAYLAMNVVGVKGVETADPLHLLPSANLIVNLNPSRNVFKAHELCQWWMPNLNLNCSVYKY